MSVPISWNADVKQVEGHQDDQARWLRKDLAPGTAAWMEGTDGEISSLVFVCPCGCGEICSIPVRVGYGTFWKWDGNRELPTLTPSILRVSPYSCGWHGFLTAGQFTSC